MKTSFKSLAFWSLVGSNALLAMTFLSRFTHDNSAIAKAQEAMPRRTGDYLMIPGEVTGGSSGVVYIVDTTNGLLSAISYDENTHRLVSMPKVDMLTVFSQAAGQQQKTEAPRRGR